MASLFNRQPKTLYEIYFSKIRPNLYERFGNRYQYRVRKGRSLAEHLDSAYQFVLTVTEISSTEEEKRRAILAATIVHDLNKLDELGRNVKTLARDPQFLEEQLQLAGVAELVGDLLVNRELIRKLIERHSGHNVSDGTRFLPEDPAIQRYAAMVTAADLFDLGIPEAQRFAKVQKELTVAFNRPSNLFRVKLTEDRGYLTSLLLGACEEVLIKHRLTPLAIFPDGELFEGEILPDRDLTAEIATVWQTKIDRIFGSNVSKLVIPTKDGIKINSQAIQQNLEETLSCVVALLEKKKAGFKLDKIKQDISKWGDKTGESALSTASNLGLLPVNNAEEFAIAEGLKCVYLSYVKAGLKSQEAWNKIGIHIGLSPEQRQALEPFNAQYGRC
jgi:CRISPR-associated protein Csc3